MLLEAVSAIHGSSLGRLKWDLRRLPAIAAGCVVHLPWAAEATTAATAGSASGSSAFFERHNSA